MSTPPSTQQRQWQKFKANPFAMAGTFFILLCALVCLGGALLRPDEAVHANTQHLALAGSKPGTTVWIYHPEKPPHISLLKKWWNGGTPSLGKEVPVKWWQIEGDSIRMQTYGDEYITVAFDKSSGTNSSTPTFESRTYWFGTDKFGRDVLSRLMAGTVISLSVGAIAVAISLLVGLTLGLIAGYYRGKVDAAIMWFTNVIWSVPTLLLVMAITFAFGTGFWKVFLAVGLTMWVEVARIVRGQVLSVREKEFVEAAKALGYSDARILFVHILPNILPPVIVISAANFAGAILIEAGLSFLGLGAQIPTPSWGNMIREHYAFITTDLAYLALVPGVLIMLTVLAFMMVGNGLRDALDVRD